MPDRFPFAFLFLSAVCGAACGGGTSPPPGDAGHATDAGIDGGTDGASATDSGTSDDAAADDAGGAIDTGAPSDGGSAPDVGGSLTVCGGLGGGVCGPTEWCDYEGSVPCGAADGTGVCRARPDSCVPVTETVCGCDGVTYSSACEASRAGTDVSASGSCGGAATFACGPAIQCETGVDYCQVAMGGAPPGHTSYSCLPLPATCTGGSTAPSCATCFPGSSTGDMCVDGGPGEMTVTLLTP